MDTISIFPEQPIGSRLIVKPRDLDMDYIKEKSTIIGSDEYVWKSKKSGLIISQEEVDKKIKEIHMSPQLADVVAVGTLKEISIVPGDVVRVFMNQFEGKITVAEEEYFIYPERCIITKVDKQTSTLLVAADILKTEDLN